MIVDGKVAAIGQLGDITDAEEIDASGLFVIPGAVDEHTHMSMPVNGTETKPWETETIAAAIGGTTTIVDFAIQAKGSSLAATTNKWKTRADGNTAIDYSLHVAITDLTDRIMEELPSAVDLGVTTFKLFMAYKGELMVDDSTIFRVLQKAKNWRACDGPCRKW